MRSKELARLAGVTVRTLRHYHQIGLLDEPSRSANGYRDYDTAHLVRVLRIRRLAALGIPLARMRPYLASDAVERARLLDELDLALAADIDRLAAQRRLVARLRAHDGPLDAPPELAPFLGLLAAGESDDLARVDRDRAVLLARLAGDARMPDLVRIYDRLSEPELVSRMAELAERFAGLAPDADAVEADALVTGFAAIILPLIADLAAAEPPIELDAVVPGFRRLTVGTLNPRQRDVVERLEALSAAEQATGRT